MSARELVVLGTASQVPTRYRNHNGYLLRWDGEGFLFDPGEGTQRQMIYADVAARAITRVCITHFHGDHCLGLAGVSQRISLDGTPHVVHAYYPASGQQYYERLRHASIYYDVGKWEQHPIAASGEVERTPAWTLRAVALDHEGVDCYGYRLEEAPQRQMLPDKLAELGIKGPAVGRLAATGSIEVGGRTVTVDEVSRVRPGQVVAFVMDTRVCDGALELARGADMLVCESTYLTADADKARDHGHMTASDAATIARDAGAGLLVLTHFSQRYQETEPFVAEAAAIFPNAIAVKDGDVIAMPKRRA
ncbi:MAG: ribonuclease Z [Deltaproteobacteria bacterium]|nr:ribonuclease Z [Deltaproteobacteria bacterium]MCW5806221.1 ribonuclease Z [Deltaproteobacteria bacterium]